MVCKFGTEQAYSWTGIGIGMGIGIGREHWHTHLKGDTTIPWFGVLCGEDLSRSIQRDLTFRMHSIGVVTNKIKGGWRVG